MKCLPVAASRLIIFSYFGVGASRLVILDLGARLFSYSGTSVVDSGRSGADEVREGEHMAIVVTGASGFIGGAIARALANTGQKVIALSRRDPEIPGVNFQRWDLREPAPATVRSLAASATSVIHCAGLPNVNAGQDDFYAIRVTGTRHLLDTFDHARFIHISSTSVYPSAQTHSDLWEEAGPGDPESYQNAYSKTHAQAEQLVARIRPDAAILRPAPLYGPNETMMMPALSRFAKKGTLRIPDGGRQKLTLTHIDNLVKAALACLDVPSASGPINIGDPTPYKLKDAVSTHFARMDYPPLVIESIATDKALFAARLGLKARSIFNKGSNEELFIMEYLRFDRTYHLSRQHRVLGISTTQHLVPSRYQS